MNLQNEIVVNFFLKNKTKRTNKKKKQRILILKSIFSCLSINEKFNSATFLQDLCSSYPCRQKG